MQIRVTVSPEGEAAVETVSLLEDLWHDYRYFLKHAESFASSEEAHAGLMEKRYSRAACVLFMFYLEGVLNNWLSELLVDEEWRKEEFTSIERKLTKVADLVPVDASCLEAFRKAKSIRNALAHLKPGNDLELWDALSVDSLRDAEAKIIFWLDAVEKDLGSSRHPNTKKESRALREALGAGGGEHTDD